MLKICIYLANSDLHKNYFILINCIYLAHSDLRKKYFMLKNCIYLAQSDLHKNYFMLKNCIYLAHKNYLINIDFLSTGTGDEFPYNWCHVCTTCCRRWSRGNR